MGGDPKGESSQAWRGIRSPIGSASIRPSLS